MTCPKCATDNPQGASFCMGCGQPLSLSCPNCGTSLPGGARFCFSCGHQIASGDRPPTPAPRGDDDSGLARYIPAELLAKLEFAAASGGMQGERRKVTMLFCDIEGSTAAAESTA